MYMNYKLIGILKWWVFFFIIFFHYYYFQSNTVPQYKYWSPKERDLHILKRQNEKEKKKTQN